MLPTFDISKSLIHHNKQDLLREKKAVDQLLEAEATIKGSIVSTIGEDASPEEDMARRLWLAVDDRALETKSRNLPDQIQDLLLNAAIDQRVSFSLFILLNTAEVQLKAQKTID